MSSTKIVLITGANQGLGFLTALLLTTPSSTQKDPPQEYHIILTARTLAKALSAIETLTTVHNRPRTAFTPLEIDIASPTSISTAFKTLTSSDPLNPNPNSITTTNNQKIDILINNAGISDHSSTTVHSTFTTTFATNITGAATVTDTFLPLLLQSQDPRIIYLSSGLGSISYAADPTNAYYNVDVTAYRCSKAAVNMLVVQQSKILNLNNNSDGKDKDGKDSRRVKVWAVDPGWRATNLSGDKERARGYGAMDPLGGAEVVVGVVRGERDGEVGMFVGEAGVVLPW